MDQEHNDQQPPAVVARGISVKGPWGPVFGPLDLDIGTGGLTALIGAAGAGRSALAMTLAGRMKPSSGSLSVFGHRRPQEIFGAAALAGIEELDTVAGSVKVQDLITEQLRWDAPWHRLVGRADDAARDTVCRPVFGPLRPPGLTEYVEQLTELDGLLLRIALANTAHRPLLVVGSVDQVSNDHDREMLVRRLVVLGEHQTVVTAAANPLPDEWGARLQVAVDDPSRTRMAARTQKGHD